MYVFFLENPVIKCSKYFILPLLKKLKLNKDFKEGDSFINFLV